MLIRPRAAAATTFSRRLGHVVGGDDRQSRNRPGSACRAPRWCPSCAPPAAPTEPTSRAAATTPVAMVSHFMMPPKMLTRIAFRCGLRSMILNASVTFSAVAPPPTSRKLAGSAAVQLDRVHGRHRQAGAVDQAADVAVERDIGQVELRRLDLGRIFLVQVAHRDDVRVAEQGVGVEIELGVERDDAAVPGEHQRVDLGQRWRRSPRTRGTAPAARRAPARRLDSGMPILRATSSASAAQKPAHRIDDHLVDLLRRLGGDFLDVHAALGAPSGRPSAWRGRRPCRRRVPADVGALFDQQPPHLLPLRARSGA